MKIGIKKGAAIASALSVTLLFAGISPAMADTGVDTTAPVIVIPATTPVKGTVTFAISQVEENPQKTYVEVQQIENGKWQKKSGTWYYGTNTFGYTVNTDALADVQTQIKISTWDVSGNHAGKSFPVVIDRIKPVVELLSPTSNVFDSTNVDLVVKATDNAALNRVVANIYKDGALYKSTQVSASGATEKTHTVDLATLIGGGVLPVGNYSVKYNATDLAGNISQTKTFDFTVADQVKPTVTLVAPTLGSLNTAGVAIQVDAADNHGLNRITANVYQGSTLVKSTSTAVGGAKSGTHAATVNLPDGSYTIRYNASDQAGNVASTGNFSFVIDTVAPTVTVKDGSTPQSQSFKLYDAGKVDKLTLNGVEKNLTDNVWSDLNGVKPGSFGAVQGTNTLVVYDVAGNSTTLVFELDTITPEVAGIQQEYQAKEGGRIAVTLTFSENIVGSTLGQGWYGSGNVYTKVYYSVKAHTVSFSDAAGNTGAYTFTVIPVVDPTPPLIPEVSDWPEPAEPTDLEEVPESELAITG